VASGVLSPALASSSPPHPSLVADDDVVVEELQERGCGGQGAGKGRVESGGR
jgi:hypothetical protein